MTDDDVPAMLDQIATLRADLAASQREVADLKDPHCDHTHRCSCGSGAHPRKCRRHPLAYAAHVDEMTAIAASVDEIATLRAEVARCREIIADSVAQHAAGYPGDGPIETSISADTEGIRYLAEIGLVEILSEFGRRVVARWTTP